MAKTTKYTLKVAEGKPSEAALNWAQGAVDYMNSPADEEHKVYTLGDIWGAATEPDMPLFWEKMADGTMAALEVCDTSINIYA